MPSGGKWAKTCPCPGRTPWKGERGMTTEVKKTVAEINKRIEQGKAVVLTAAEMVEAVRRLGKVKAAKEVDVVATGTFSPMEAFFSVTAVRALVCRLRMARAPASRRSRQSGVIQSVRSQNGCR